MEGFYRKPTLKRVHLHWHHPILTVSSSNEVTGDLKTRNEDPRAVTLAFILVQKYVSSPGSFKRGKWGGLNVIIVLSRKASSLRSSQRTKARISTWRSQVSQYGGLEPAQLVIAPTLTANIMTVERATIVNIPRVACPASMGLDHSDGIPHSSDQQRRMW